MLQRWRIPAVCLVLVAIVVVAGLLSWARQPIYSAAIVDLPAGVQAGVLKALADAGYDAVSDPVWAGAQESWAAPGDYRLYFAASRSEGSVEVFSAAAHVDSHGQVERVASIVQVTDTAAGEEAAPVIADGWLAFATRAAGRYQSITCVPLANPKRLDVYAFDQPTESVDLEWTSAAGGPVLRVFAGALTGGSEFSVDPAQQRVEPVASGLAYIPVVRGEQAWLPNLVSRVRELPGVGPEKIAFAENVFFTAVDWVTRLTHASPSPSPTAEPLPSATPTASATRQPSLASTAPAVSPTSTTPTPTHTPTVTPTPQGAGLAEGILWRGSVSPDPQRPYANVEIVEIDPSLLQVKMICGTHEPKPSTGLVGTGVIPQEDWPHLVAGFNGGFAALHGQYGMMVDRKVYLPPREGIATLAVYEDGSIRMGTWGKDLVLTSDMVSFRQNCLPLIENGIITAETGKLTLWGLSVSNEVYLYRSGLGVTEDGRLIYVAGKPLTAYTLARALQMAGAHYAMQLDVDEYHVAFFTYDVRTDESGLKVTGKKLRDDMHGFDGYFLRPFQLDFFYLTRRSEPLENAVRMAPQGVELAELPTLVPHDLPGRIAFASDRDGNWEIYTMDAGQPDSLQRLTQDPADDLHPAWSRDGQRLAFTSRRGGNADIYVMDVADGSLRAVAPRGSEEWSASWSPDGQVLAYQSDRNGQSDVYICTIDGGEETRLTPMEGNHEAPSWGPEGQRLVFDSDLDVSELVHATINLYIMGADGSTPRRIHTNAEFPRWSPDGSTIAFISRRTGRWQVYLLNPDGSGLRQLTRGAYDARYPAWSPDGRWVAYAGNEHGHWEVYAIRVEGGEPVQLTSSQGDSTYPAWAP